MALFSVGNLDWVLDLYWWGGISQEEWIICCFEDKRGEVFYNNFVGRILLHDVSDVLDGRFKGNKSLNICELMYGTLSDNHNR